MLLIFSTADTIYSDYRLALIWGAVIVVVTLIALGYANVGTQSEVRPVTAIKIGVASYVFFALVAYNANYANFIKAEISSQEVKMEFTGDWYKPTVIQREQIKEVRFGNPGKGDRTCYIKFVTQDDQVYRSANTEGKVCKEYRAQIVALMKLQ